MTFMQRQITHKQTWLKVETTHGTFFVDGSLHLNVSNCPADEVENNPIWASTVRQYVEGEPQVWEWIKGYGARLSAPGYLDCTEWAVFDTPEQAQAYLDEYYPEDDADEEESAS